MSETGLHILRWSLTEAGSHCFQNSLYGKSLDSGMIWRPAFIIWTYFGTNCRHTTCLSLMNQTAVLWSVKLKMGSLRWLWQLITHVNYYCYLYCRLIFFKHFRKLARCLWRRLNFGKRSHTTRYGRSQLWILSKRIECFFKGYLKICETAAPIRN